MPYAPYLSHAADPATASDAADRAVGSGLARTHERRILAVLRHMHAGGTGSEIAAACAARFGSPSTNVEVMRRMAALINRGQVYRHHDPADPEGIRKLKRGSETIHYLWPAGMELFQAALGAATERYSHQAQANVAGAVLREDTFGVFSDGPLPPRLVLRIQDPAHPKEPEDQ